MTKEEKQILLKDLCARVIYGVLCTDLRHGDSKITEVDIEDSLVYCFDFDEWVKVENCRLYLRPISSMTESEMDKLFDILHIDKDGNNEDWIKINDVLGIKFFFPTGKWVENVIEAYDYLNSIHIDYRGLIPMGLALEASEGMYKIE